MISSSCSFLPCLVLCRPWIWKKKYDFCLLLYFSVVCACEVPLPGWDSWLIFKTRGSLRLKICPIHLFCEFVFFFTMVWRSMIIKSLFVSGFMTYLLIFEEQATNFIAIFSCFNCSNDDWTSKSMMDGMPLANELCLVLEKNCYLRVCLWHELAPTWASCIFFIFNIFENLFCVSSVLCCLWINDQCLNWWSKLPGEWLN